MTKEEILNNLSDALSDLEQAYYLMNDVINILTDSFNDAKEIGANVDLTTAISKSIQVRNDIKDIGDLIVNEGNKVDKIIKE